MKKESITRFKLNPKKPPKTDWRAFDGMSEEARHRAAVSDPDAPPASKAQLARARRVPTVRALRAKVEFDAGRVCSAVPPPARDCARLGARRASSRQGRTSPANRHLTKPGRGGTRARRLAHPMSRKLRPRLQDGLSNEKPIMFAISLDGYRCAHPSYELLPALAERIPTETGEVTPTAPRSRACAAPSPQLPGPAGTCRRRCRCRRSVCRLP